MKKIKIAQIGISNYSHGNQCAMSLSRLTDLFDFAGIALPENEEELCKGQMQYIKDVKRLTLDEILNDPTIEAVAVETEEKYLTEYAIKAAEHGKHIHMEKPGGTDIDDFHTLIEKMRNSGKVFHTGYMYRQNPVIKKLIKRIEDGELGEILSVEAQMNCEEPPELRRWLAGYKGGMMFFLGCHLVDLVYRIMGEPKKIIPYNRSTNADGIVSEDFGMALWEYSNGISIIKTNGYEIGGFNRRQLVVVGTKGTVELKPLEWYYNKGPLISTDEYNRFEHDWTNIAEPVKHEAFDRYDGMLVDFYERINGREEKVYTLDYEKRLYELICESL